MKRTKLLFVSLAALFVAACSNDMAEIQMPELEMQKAELSVTRSLAGDSLLLETPVPLDYNGYTMRYAEHLNVRYASCILCK